MGLQHRAKERMTALQISVQLSLGRFPTIVEETDSVKVMKAKVRKNIQEISHVNLNGFRANVRGVYLSDESKSLKDWGVKAGDVIHFVKKTACPNAALDTEKKADDE